jgi:type II secretory pathway component PulM
MNSSESWDKNVIALLATVSVFILFLLIYFFPRTSQLSKTKDSIEELRGVRQEVSVLLPEVARTVATTPEPLPDVRSWIAANALSGIEKNLVANDGYLQGKGAQVKLRRLQPKQAAGFLSSLTRVRLIVERMQLQDSDGDGHWDMEINLKVP